VSVHRAHSPAPPERVWELLARPALWSEWAPHIRGASGLGDPEVEAGARGTVSLLGVVPVPARVTAKEPGRSWTWRVGPMELEHRVTPHRSGSSVAIEMRAPLPVRVAYGPLVALLVRNLSRVAASR
jgi:uncharacterized protein YndB with AHSA1/START domain